MKLFWRREAHRHVAFTLLEILIAMAILAMISALVAFALNPSKQFLSVKDVKRGYNANQLQNALYQYFVDKGHFPSEELIPLGPYAPTKQVCSEGVVSDPGCINVDVLKPDFISDMWRDDLEPCSDYTGLKIYKDDEQSIVVEALHTGMPSENITSSTGPCIRQPPTMTPIGWLSLVSANAVDVQGNYAYVIRGGAPSPNEYWELDVVDISNPLAPVLVGFVEAPSGGDHIIVRGTKAYVTGGTLQIFDVTNPTNPVFDWEIGMNVRDAVIVDDFAFLATDTAMQIVNVSAGPSPSMSLPLGSQQLSIAAQGDHVFLGGLNGVLTAINISNPTSPVVVGTANAASAAITSIAISGNYAYATSNWLAGDYLNIFSITDPTAMIPMAPIATNDWPVHIFLHFTQAYISNALGNTIQVFDIHDPLSVEQFLEVPTQGSAYGVDIVFPYVYVIDRAVGLVIYRL